MEGGNTFEPQALPLRQWLMVFSGILMVAVPWWLGLLWMFGALN